MKRLRKTALLQMLNDYRFNSILIKNLLVIFFALICSFSALTWLVSWKMENIVHREAVTLNENALNQTKERMDTLMNEVVQISAQLSLDDEIMMFLLPETNGGVDPEATYQTKERIREYSGIFDYIDSIYVYANKQRYIVTSDGGGNLEKFTDLTWYNNLTERIYEPSRMISRLKNNSYPLLVSYIQPIRLTQMQFLGGIIVNIDVDKLYEQIVTESFDTFLVVDDRDNVIFSSAQDQVMKKWNQLEYAQYTDGSKNNADTININGEEMLIAAVHSQEFDWSYISVVPMERYQSYRSDFRNFFKATYLLVFFISIVVAAAISIYSYHPVQYILGLLKNPDLFDAQEPTENGLRQDEIHEITGNIVRNFYSSRQMQKELEDYLGLVNQAQITALQAQISPHFLFNTLENLRWKAMELSGGENEVSGIIMNLSEMLRVSLDNTRQIILLEEEIRNAKLYIEILQLRYGDKVSVSWEIEEALCRYQIVKVTLQPLIENAVYHGIKPRRGKGHIVIRAFKEGERLKLQVADDGIGMSPEECEALNRDLQEMYVMKAGHIGVRNVGQRLKLILGEQVGMHITSVQGEGTTVEIDLPLKYLSEEGRR